MENLEIVSPVSRSHRSSREMFPLVERWFESGEKQLEFCKFHGLRVSTFAYWLKKYRDHVSVSKKSGHFVALSFPKADLVGSEIEIIFPNGIKIQADRSLGAGFIRELLGIC